MLVKLQAFTGAEQPPDAICKKVLSEKCSQNSQEKACVRDPILIKLHSKAVKKRLWHKCFPVNLAKFLRTPFLLNTSGRLLPLLAFQKQPPEVYYKKCVLENFAKFIRRRKHLWFAKFSKTPFLQNTSGRLLLAFSCNVTKMGYCQQCLEKLRWIFIT